MTAVWPALREGDRIRVVAPSGPFDTRGLEAGITLLQTRFRVQTRADLHDRSGFLAGDDERRIEELLEAVRDESVGAIVAARGGYGATRLLGRVTDGVVAALKRSPKLLVGFSDITALHGLWRRAGVGSLHGSMAARIATLPEPLQARWLEALSGRFPHTIEGLSPITAGTGVGPLFGGNLSVLYALLGTPHMPSLRGCVLFLEDINERPYAVDRMLTALRDSGCLEGVAAIALGSFTESQPGPDGVTVETVLGERLGDLGVPVAVGLRAGHVDDNQELPFGTQVELDANAGRLRLAPHRPSAEDRR